MFEVISQAAAIIACGVLWRKLSPADLDPAVARRVLTGLVYYLLLPALVLNVMWHAPASLSMLRVSALAVTGIGVSLLLAHLWLRRAKVAPAQAGALLLAAAFPNVAYLGLPVLEQSLGSWARSVALQYDLFATTPVLFTLGILIARRYGTATDEPYRPLHELVRIPALLAAVVGLGLSMANVPLPLWLERFLPMLGSGVVPLMLISLGLGLAWPAQWRQQLNQIAPIATIRLVLTPALIWLASYGVVSEEPLRTAIVLEAAMPSMLLGVVMCDRYGLDTPLYAATVTMTTLLALGSLPAWFAILS